FFPGGSPSATLVTPSEGGTSRTASSPRKDRVQRSNSRVISSNRRRNSCSAASPVAADTPTELTSLSWNTRPEVAAWPVDPLASPSRCSGAITVTAAVSLRVGTDTSAATTDGFVPGIVTPGVPGAWGTTGTGTG